MADDHAEQDLAASPLAVQSARPDRSRPIVVGLDPSEAARAALRWAAAEARLRGTSLEVVVACEAPSGDFLPADDEQSLRGPHEIAHDFLRNTLREEAPGLQDLEGKVSGRVLDGPASTSLVEAARDAELLVVGARGHGQLLGMVLGSVSLCCASHATRPVVVVRSTDGRS